MKVINFKVSELQMFFDLKFHQIAGQLEKGAVQFHYILNHRKKREAFAGFHKLTLGI